MTNGNGLGVLRVKDTTVANVFLGILVSICVALSSFSLREIYQMNARMSAIEHNRFTSKDGLDVWKEIAKIQASIATAEASPRDVPAVWFAEKVEQNRLRIEKLENNR